MLTKHDIVTYHFGEEHQSLVQGMADQCWLGSDDAQHATHGTQQHDPSQYLEDQITGQYGELALHWMFYGVEKGTEFYILQREERNKDKYKGDGGSDLWKSEFRIDAKASTMRHSKNPLDYNLIVRPRDWYDDTVYILMLRRPNEAEIMAVGYAWTEDLPTAIKSSGPFAGAHAKRARFLRPLTDFISS